jgi:hypothetical protein
MGLTSIISNTSGCCICFSSQQLTSNWAFLLIHGTSTEYKFRMAQNWLPANLFGFDMFTHGVHGDQLPAEDNMTNEELGVFLNFICPGFKSPCYFRSWPLAHLPHVVQVEILMATGELLEPRLPKGTWKFLS